MDLISVNSTTLIFGNDLLFRNITAYLKIPDLKILRQTSKSMLNKVNNFSGFIKNLKITICLKSIQEGVISQSTLPFRKANLAMEDYDDPNFEKIKHCLRQVQDLQICVETSFRPKNVHQICDLILQLKYLKSLSVPLEFLTWENVLSTLSAKLSMLEGLRLFTNTMEWRDYRSPVSKIRINKNWAFELCNLDCKLKFFHAIKAFFPTSTLASILKKSANTLGTLKLISNAHRIPVNSFVDLIFYNLKSIKYNCSLADGEKFAAFLQNHPSLQSIEVGVVPLFNRGIQIHYIPPQIMNAIREKSSQLKTLDFCGDMANWRELFRTSRDYEFIQLCGKLKEFRLPRHGHLAPDLPLLPCNVASLDLFNLEADGMDPVFLLEKFPHLTQLKIASPTAVTDDVLQSICRNIPALRVFHFRNELLRHRNVSPAGVTDFGLTGERGDGHEDSGISLSNLKGLRELVMLGSDNERTR